MRLVALVPGGIGDQILFFPILDDLKRYYPNALIDVVTEPRSIAAYQVSKSVHDVLKFDFSDRNSMADWANLVGNIRDREYDVAINLTPNAFINLLLWLTGVPTRIGFEGKGSQYLTNRVPQKTSEYIPDQYYELLPELGIESTCPELTINIPKSDFDWANSEQVRLGVKETGYILIHGGFNDQAKVKSLPTTYPVKKWIELLRNFISKQPDTPVVVVSEANNPDVNYLVETLPDLKVTSPPDIGKLAAIVAGANLMLCTDNEAMQLAVAVQTYTIALFGPTDPKTVLPQSDKFRSIQSLTGKMEDIVPATVLETIFHS